MSPAVVCVSSLAAGGAPAALPVTLQPAAWAAACLLSLCRPTRLPRPCSRSMWRAARRPALPPWAPLACMCCAAPTATSTPARPTRCTTASAPTARCGPTPLAPLAAWCSTRQGCCWAGAGGCCRACLLWQYMRKHPPACWEGGPRSCNPCQGPKHAPPRLLEPQTSARCCARCVQRTGRGGPDMVLAYLSLGRSLDAAALGEAAWAGRRPARHASAAAGRLRSTWGGRQRPGGLPLTWHSHACATVGLPHHTATLHPALPCALQPRRWRPPPSASCRTGASR